MSEPKLYTRKEVAEILKVKPRTLWHWEQKGWLVPKCHVNNRPRYSIEEVDRIAADTSSTQKKKTAKDFVAGYKKYVITEKQLLDFGQRIHDYYRDKYETKA